MIIKEQCFLERIVKTICNIMDYLKYLNKKLEKACKYK